MRTRLLIILVTILPFHPILAQGNDVYETMTDEASSFELPRIRVIPIRDNQNNREYELYVKLPEGYVENDSIQYPVLYTTDAMWHMELLSTTTEYIIEDIILVGISWQTDNDPELVKERGAHVSRFRDYSVRPLSDPERQAKYQLGQAGDHLEFIRNDVFKYIESNYRAAPDQRTYFGYSLGGLFGTYVLLAKGDTFKNYIIGSPSLKGNISYLRELSSTTIEKYQSLNVGVYISHGSLEQELGNYVDQLLTILNERNDKSLSVSHEVNEGNHQTAFPLTGLRGTTWLSSLKKN